MEGKSTKLATCHSIFYLLKRELPEEESGVIVMVTVSARDITVIVILSFTAGDML